MERKHFHLPKYKTNPSLILILISILSYIEEIKFNKLSSKVLLIGLCLFFINPVMTAPEYPDNSNEIIHIVKKGDTLYSLSKTYGVSIREIKELNGLGSSDFIRVGQKLRLPVSEESRYRKIDNSVPPIHTLIAPERNQTEEKSDTRPLRWQDELKSSSGSSARYSSATRGQDYDPARVRQSVRSRSYHADRFDNLRIKNQNNADYLLKNERSSASEYLFRTQRVANGPREDIQLVLNRIRLTKNSTILTFVVENLGNKSFPFKLSGKRSKKAWYLTDRTLRQTYHLKSIDNLDGWKLGMAYYLKGGESLLFSAEFDRLDNDVSVFHLIEGEDMNPGNWNIFEIALNPAYESRRMRGGDVKGDSWDYNNRTSNVEDDGYNKYDNTSHWEQEVWNHTNPEVLDIVDRLDVLRRQPLSYGNANRRGEKIYRGSSAINTSIYPPAGGGAEESFLEEQRRVRQKRQAAGQIYYYRVKRGDSLNSLSRLYNNSVEEIMSLNNLESEYLRIGKIIKVIRREG